MNALTHGMVTAIAAALDAWEDDDGVATVLLSGAGERGLCAGGDIVAIYRDALRGGGQTARFWADEYRLNALIARYSEALRRTDGRRGARRRSRRLRPRPAGS